MKINRFKRRLYSVVRDLEDLSEFIENNNVPGSRNYAEAERAMHEVDEMAAKVRNMESRADKMMFVEY